MRLVPEKIVCPDHPEQDLTCLVTVELLADPDSVTNALLRPGRRRRGLQRYLVIVTCPGGADGGHEQEVEGSWEA